MIRVARILGLAFAAVLAAAATAYATTRPSQVVFGPGSPVILTGATVAAPGATAGGGVIVDTVNTLTNGYLLDLRNNGVSKFSVDYSGTVTGGISLSSTSAVVFARTPASSAWTTPFTFTSPSDTSLTLSTEFNDWLYTGATKTWATGALTTERAVKIGFNTYAFAGGSTVTNGVTWDILGGPNAGSNATITNDSALRIESSNVAAGGGSVTHAFSLMVTAPTGGGDNTAATFNGAVGIAASANFVPTSGLLSVSDVAATTGTIADVTHTTSVIANGGSAFKVSSTSVDTGTSTGNLIDASASGSVAGTLVRIAATNASQTTETALAVTQGGTTAAYTGNFISFTGSSTTGSGGLLALTCVNTTGGFCESITSNSASTSTAGVLALSATGLTSGTGMLLTGGGANLLTSGKVLDVEMGAATVGAGVKIVTSGTYTDTAAAPLWVSTTGTTGNNGLRIDANALTTGSAINIPHTTSVIANGGSLVAVSSTSVDTGTTTGNLLDLSATGSVASTMVRIAASNASQTTEQALAVTQSGTGAGFTGSFIAFTGSSTTGTGNLLQLTCVNTTNGQCEQITNNALTTGVGLQIAHTTSVISGAGSLVRISSTGVDTSTTNGSLLDLSSTASVTSTLVNIAASANSQTTETALNVVQTTTTTGYTGSLVHFTGSSTTGTGNVLQIDAVNTTAGQGVLINANSATTTNASAVKISTTALTSGTSLSILGSAPATMTSGGKFLRINDGTTDVFAVGYDGHIAAASTTAAVATNTGGSAITCVNGNNTGQCSDTRGEVRVTTAANTNPIVVTFHSAFAAAPICVVSPANLNYAVDAASGTIAPAVTTSTTALTITPGANWAANAKILRYICME